MFELTRERVRTTFVRVLLTKRVALLVLLAGLGWVGSPMALFGVDADGNGDDVGGCCGVG